MAVSSRLPGISYNDDFLPEASVRYSSVETQVAMKRWAGKTGPVHSFGVCDIDESSVKAILGQPHFVEDDSTRTHSGTEMCWVFETESGDALAFSFHQIIGRLFMATSGEKAIAEREAKAKFGLDYSPTHGLLWD